jgi:hypothetical protein
MDDINNLVPLDSVILDPRNEEELLEQSQLRVYNSSGGQLNDFSENSPVAALLQGQAFAGSELLYYANQLPLALVIDFLKITGISRRLGTKAKATLTFNLSSPQSLPFTILQGFEVLDESGNFSFYTDANLQIPAGLVSGSVTATAETVGSAYNIPAYSLTGISQPITYLSGVTNVEPSLGGTDEESVESTIERALIALRQDNLVSADDYENAAESILGEGSVCKAIGLLAEDRASTQLGAVHIFLLNADKQPANEAQLTQVKSGLETRIQLGTSLYTSPMELLNINGELVAKLASGKNPEEAIDELWQVFLDYLDPSTYPVGQDIILNEVEYLLRLAGNIKAIESLTLNGEPLNIPLANSYTLPTAYSLYIRLVAEDGLTYEGLRGAGEPEFFGGI